MAHFSTSMRLLVQAAQKLGVKVQPIDRAHNLARFTYRGTSVLGKGTVPPANNMVASRISVSKHFTKLVLAQAGITRFPRAEHVHSLAEASAAARKLGYPLVDQAGCGRPRLWRDSRGQKPSRACARHPQS
ncbi:MAG: hypothetical protein U0514_04160 [Candidatus Andersenbacteria bacterium]